MIAVFEMPKSRDKRMARLEDTWNHLEDVRNKDNGRLVLSLAGRHVLELPLLRPGKALPVHD
jgi:hypothetical protein